jgi:predicted amidophosphoribosyltransferase
VSAGTAPAIGALSCPRCGAHVSDDQDWCLRCGDAARTRLAPTPNWRAPIALAAVVAALAGLVLALAFVALTRDEAPLQPTTATTAAPAATAPPAVTPAPPPTTAPPTATTAPTATPPAASTTTPPGATATTP